VLPLLFHFPVLTPALPPPAVVADLTFLSQELSSGDLSRIAAVSNLNLQKLTDFDKSRLALVKNTTFDLESFRQGVDPNHATVRANILYRDGNTAATVFFTYVEKWPLENRKIRLIDNIFLTSLSLNGEAKNFITYSSFSCLVFLIFFLKPQLHLRALVCENAVNCVGIDGGTCFQSVPHHKIVMLRFVIVILDLHLPQLQHGYILWRVSNPGTNTTCNANNSSRACTYTAYTGGGTCNRVSAGTQVCYLQ